MDPKLLTYIDKELHVLKQLGDEFAEQYPDYVPAGSTVTVETRQTLVAATATIVSAVPTVPARRRTRR